jgi:hypothetical protein
MVTLASLGMATVSAQIKSGDGKILGSAGCSVTANVSRQELDDSVRKAKESKQPTSTSAVSSANNNETITQVGNYDLVTNLPAAPTDFTVNEPSILVSIENYHWNNGKGADPGQIGILNLQTSQSSWWDASGRTGSYGAPNAYWTIKPGVQIGAGTYRVLDSDNKSWSQNSGSGGRGFSIVITKKNLKNEPAVKPASSSKGSVASQKEAPFPCKRKVSLTFRNESQGQVELWTEGTDRSAEGRFFPIGETKIADFSVAFDSTGKIKFYLAHPHFGQYISDLEFDSSSGRPLILKYSNGMFSSCAF